MAYLNAPPGLLSTAAILPVKMVGMRPFLLVASEEPYRTLLEEPFFRRVHVLFF